MTAPFRVGLIGCGRAAERLWIPALRAVREASLVAAVDMRAERRALIASRISGCRAIEDAESLIGQGSVDGVIIATPPGTHAGLVRLALEAHVPVLVEKPLASTVDQAVELDELRRARATPLMMGLNRRWWRPARRLRELLRRNATPARAELAFVTPAAEWNAIDGMPDLLDDLATHQLDLLRFLFDQKIESVSASQPNGSEVRMDVRLTNRTAAQCRVAYEGRSEESVRVTAGSLRAWIHAGSDRLGPAEGPVRTAVDVGERIWRKLSRGRSSMRRSFEEELRGFIRSVRTGAEPSPGPTDAIAAARAVAAVRESLSRGGLPVSV